jgi:hypothetical protein
MLPLRDAVSATKQDEKGAVYVHSFFRLTNPRIGACVSASLYHLLFVCFSSLSLSRLAHRCAAPTLNGDDEVPLNGDGDAVPDAVNSDAAQKKAEPLANVHDNAANAFSITLGRGVSVTAFVRHNSDEVLCWPPEVLSAYTLLVPAATAVHLTMDRLRKHIPSAMRRTASVSEDALLRTGRGRRGSSPVLTSLACTVKALRSLGLGAIAAALDAAASRSLSAPHATVVATIDNASGISGISGCGHGGTIAAAAAALDGATALDGAIAEPQEHGGDGGGRIVGEALPFSIPVSIPISIPAARAGGSLQSLQLGASCKRKQMSHDNNWTSTTNEDADNDDYPAWFGPNDDDDDDGTAYEASLNVSTRMLELMSVAPMPKMPK